jgi:ABC-2 type transport system ATP-binding protein
VIVTGGHDGCGAAIATNGLSRTFGWTAALTDVTFGVPRGQVHALLGPNGAGKTTLIRILMGLVRPTAGVAQIDGRDVTTDAPALHRTIGLVPSGDRSFYLRISGLENLVFFARLHGLSRREARRRAFELLARVDLEDAAPQRVGLYSHGMQKRLSFARALLGNPSVLLVDEATHDLDPDGAERVRTLAREACRDGAAVLWATQRLEEIRGFADDVTLLHRGRVRFRGSVHELSALALPRRHVVRLANCRPAGEALAAAAASAVGRLGTLSPVAHANGEHYVLALREGFVLGDALAALANVDIQVLSCREYRSEIEEAFLTVTADGSP